MIKINPTLAIDESEIHEEFIRASGPGGQNVNKVATAVQLRFDVKRSRSLPDCVRERLILSAKGRINNEGILIIDSRRFRTQQANRQDGIKRLVELIHKAAQEPQIRHKTRPTLASKMRRLETKYHRARVKELRRPVSEPDDG